VYYLYPPAIKHSDSAPNLAKQKLKEMGAISLQEKLMMMIFLILIFLWVFGPNLFGINATATALVGFCLLLLFRMISFEETIGDKSAWHTFIWFATLLMISSFLSKMGIMNWIGIKLQSSFSGLSPTYSIIFLSLVYFYIHYIFASATAHITVLFPTFLLLFTASGVPDMVAALMLTFLSILSSGLTHFGLSSSPIFFGAGYVKTKTWWYIGLIMSIVNIIIWSTIGAAWWKILALW
jgi:DASS family divalent anion:Na+ symporter